MESYRNIIGCMRSLRMVFTTIQIPVLLLASRLRRNTLVAWLGRDLGGSFELDEQLASSDSLDHHFGVHNSHMCNDVDSGQLTLCIQVYTRASPLM